MRPLILCLLLSGCANLKPAYMDGKPEVGVAKSGGWSVLVRGRGVAMRREF